MRALLLLPFLAACAAPAPPSSGTGILAVGDSVMAWNGGRGIPEAVAATLDRPVTDASRSGAHLTHPSAAAAALGFDVSRQASAEGWDWVILTGGGNDLRGACGTAEERAVLDGIVDERLRGDLPALVGRLRAAGAKVAYLGYYDPSTDGATAFTPCERAFDAINARMARLAARDRGLVVLDAGRVVDRADRGAYAADLIHPSPRASAAIGRALAEAMRGAEAG